ncbi:hypothetical protein Droror1_Dr00001990 [Drosera rotundifolia]
MAKQMKRAELKQDSIRLTLEKLNSESSGLIMLTVQWKDLEDHFETARREIRRSIEEIEAREARLGEETRELDVKRKEVEAMRGLVRECYDKVNEKEEELEVKIGEAKEREMRMDAREAVAAKEMTRVVEKERKLYEMESAVLRLEEDLESMKRELGFTETEAMKRFEEFRMQEKEFVVKLDRFEMEKGEFEEKCLEFELRIEDFGDREVEVMKRFEEVRLQEEEFEVKLGEFEVEKREFEEKCKEIESRGDDLGFREMEVMKRFEEVQLQEKGFELKLGQFEKEKREFEEKSKEFELKGKEIGFREMEVMKRLDEVEKREEEFEVILDRFDMGKQELEEKENEFEMRASRRLEELEAREKDLEMANGEVAKRLDDVEMKEKQFVQNVNGFKRKEMELEEKLCEIELKVKQLNEKEAVVARKMMLVEKMESKLSNMELMAIKVQEELESRKKKLSSWQMEVIKRMEEVILKEEEFEFNLDQLQKEKRELEEKLEEFESNSTRQMEELESKEKDLENSKGELAKRFDEVQMKEREFEEIVNRFKRKEREFNEKIKEIELKEEQLKGVISNEKAMSVAKAVPLQSKQKEPGYVKQCNSKSLKEQKLKENHVLGNICPVVKTEPLSDLMVDNTSNDGGIIFHVKMDGKTLQTFLNDRYDDHQTMRDEVCYALKMSSDPARLVLDAMFGFFPPHLKQDSVEYETRVVRSSCILLLEQLLKLKPSLKDITKRVATELALEWMEKMKSGRESYAEVLGFLLLAAVYRLSAEFDKNELQRLLGMVDKDLAHQLYPSLGFSAQGAEKNANLSEPTPTTVNEVSKKRSASASTTTLGTQPSEQTQEKRPKVAYQASVTSNDSGGILSTVESSESHLQAPCSIVPVIKHILEKSNADNDKLTPPVNVCIMSTRNELDSLCQKMDADHQAKSSSEVLASRSVWHQLETEHGSDPVGASPMGSRSEINTQCEKKVVTHAASSASEVGTVENNHPLPKAMQINHAFAIELHKGTLKCARQRKATFAKEGNVAGDVFGFFMYVAAFRLGSYFETRELVSLFDTFYNDHDVYRLEQNVMLCHALSLEGNIPGVVDSLIKENKMLHAIRYVCAFNLVARFPIFHLLGFHAQVFKNKVRNCKKGTDEFHAQVFKNKVRNCKNGTDEAQLLSELASREITELRGLVRCVSKCKWFEGKNFIAAVEQRIDTLEHEMLKGEKNPPAIAPAEDVTMKRSLLPVPLR